MERKGLAAKMMRSLVTMPTAQLALHLGGLDVFLLDAFLTGYELATIHAGKADDTYGQFTLWLRDVKREHPAAGWPAYFMGRARQNKGEAIDLVLNRMREFLGVSEGSAST